MEPLRLAAALMSGVIAIGSPAAAEPAGAGRPAARLVAEWDPGWSAAEAGGRFTVNGYGVGGLGAYRLGLDDGAVALAVCVQADVGHSMAADYRPDPSPTVSSPELDYLLWRMSGPPGLADDLTAAATNVLAWRHAGAVRSTGGPVWSGDRLEVAVVGGGRRTDIEAAVLALYDEAGRRKGPWTLSEPVLAPDGSATVVVAGPGGPIGGVAVTVANEAASWSVVTDEAGVARFETGAGGRLVVTVSGPGPARTWSAPGSQRVAAAGPPVEHAVELVITPPTTTTTTTTTTVPPTTTTTVPPTTTTTTSPTTTTTTTTVPATTVPATVPSTTVTSTTVPATTTSTVAAVTSAPTTTPAPPTALGAPTATLARLPIPAPSATLPRTGGGSRPLVRVGAWAVALGGVAVLLAARSRPPGLRR